MTVSKEHGTVCSAESEIRTVETSSMPYWGLKSTRGWLGAIFGLSIGANWLVGAQWQQPAMVTLLFLAAIYQVVVRYKYRRSCEESTARRRSDLESANNRLEVYGDSSDLAKLQGLSSKFFEPYIVRYNTLWDRIPSLWIFVMLSVVVVFAMVLMWPGLTVTTGALAAISVIMLPVLAGLVFPCYFRISPGRLDRLVFGPFSVKTRRTRTMSLTDARIVCRLDKDYILITQNGELDAWRIRLEGLREPRDFVRKVLEGALTKPSCAKLPDDELLG